LEGEKTPDVRKSLAGGPSPITELASDKPATKLAAVRMLDQLRSIPALDLIIKLEGEALAKTRRLSAGSADRHPHGPETHRGSHFLRHIHWHFSFAGISLSAVLLIAGPWGLAITFRA